METATQQQPEAKLIRILAFTLVISMMSATMFNVALPEIRDEFDLSLSQVSWVTSAYLLVYAIGTVIYGKLADSYRLKDLITFGLLFFAFGSTIGLAAQAYWAVLLGRTLQAAGAAVIPATASIIPVRYYPTERRGRALGIAMTGLSIGAALGPAGAALVLNFLHWRFLFCIPLFTLFVLPFYRKYLDDNRGKGSNIDWFGAMLLAFTVSALLLAITSRLWELAAAGLVLLGLFAVRICFAAMPFVQPGLFRRKGYALGLAIAFLVTGVGYSLAFLSPQLLTQVNRLEPGLVGFAMVPAAVVSAILGRKGGKLADTKGNGFVFGIGCSLLFICFVLLSSFTGVSPVWIAMFLIFGMVGQSFMYLALSNSISRTLPAEQTGVGMGLLAMLNFIAGAVSAGIYGRAVDQGADLRMTPVNPHDAAFVYSSIYLILAGVLVVVAIVYMFMFNRLNSKEKA